MASASVGAVTVEGHLTQLVMAEDWRGLARQLAALGEDERALALQWYRNEGSALVRKIGREQDQRPWEPNAPREAWLLRASLAISLAPTPQAAARDSRLVRSTWSDGEPQGPGGFEALIDLLVARGPEWCAQFVDANEPVLRGENAHTALARFGRVVLPAVSRLGLALFSSETYVRAFVAYTLAVFHGTRWGSLGSSLAEAWREVPFLGQTLAAALRLEGAMATWDELDGEGFSLEGEVRELVRSEPEAREPILEAALTLFSRQEPRGAQRAAIRVLAGLDLTPADLEPRMPLVVNLLPGVHGVTTAALLPLALGADPAPEDLREIGTTILTRKEKAQKTLLLKHLASMEDPAARDVVVDLLTLASLSEDSAFAARARKALEALGESAPESSPLTIELEWRSDAEVTPRAAARFEAVEANAAGLASLFGRTEEASELAVHARWLDLAVRLGARDLRALRAALREAPRDHWGTPLVYRMLRDWAEGDERLTVSRTAEGWVRSAGKPREQPHRVTPSTAFLVRLTHETIARLGKDPELLSTPSREDGTLELEVLLARMRRAASYHPLDLQQALLRLGPLDPGEAAGLEGLSLPPADSRGRLGRLLGARPSLPDGGQVLRDWIRAGGLPPRPCSVLEGVAMAPAVELPVILPGAEPLADLVAELKRPDPGALESHAVASVLDVVPWWPDLAVVVVGMRHWFWFERATRPDLSSAAGELGPAVHHHLLWWLAEDLEHRRLAGAAELSALAAQGRLDAAMLREAAIDMASRGQLPLARAAAALEHVILTGGLSAVWPTLAALAERGAQAPRLPAGLADLLRTMQPYAAAAEPHLPLPAAVLELAARKGSTKAILEARALVAAAGGTP